MHLLFETNFMKFHTSLILTIITSLFITSCSLLYNKIPMTTPTLLIPENAQIATFAGGCFWCLEPSFDAEP
jgi:hypothetical protein